MGSIQVQKYITQMQNCGYKEKKGLELSEFFSDKLHSICCVLISEIKSDSLEKKKKSRCISQLFEGKKHSVFIVMSFLLYHCLLSMWVVFLL